MEEGCGGAGVEEQGGSKRAGTAVKEDTQGKRRLAEQESPPSLGYDWFFPCARMTTKKIKTKIQNGALKTKMRGGGGVACWDVVLAVVLLFYSYFCSVKPR